MEIKPMTKQERQIAEYIKNLYAVYELANGRADKSPALCRALDLTLEAIEQAKEALKIEEAKAENPEAYAKAEAKRQLEALAVQLLKAGLYEAAADTMKKAKEAALKCSI